MAPPPFSPFSSREMQEVPITMRSFGGEPLSINRLRQTERTGDVLIRRVCNENEPQFSGSPTSERYPAPPTDDFHEEVNELDASIQEKPVVLPSTSNHDMQGDSDDEEMAQMFSPKSYMVPSKSQVLFYLSSSINFKIVRSGSDIQITDGSDFPLMDVWAEQSCCSSAVWVVESYGRRVLIMCDVSSLTWTPFRRPAPNPTQSVTDWNGDLIGYFLPGDPFLIQNNSRTTVARCVTTDPTARRECWQCVLEGSDREIARLERGSLRFAPELGFQLKLLILAALSRAVAGNNRQPLCWPFWGR